MKFSSVRSGIHLFPGFTEYDSCVPRLSINVVSGYVISPHFCFSVALITITVPNSILRGFRDERNNFYCQGKPRAWCGKGYDSPYSHNARRSRDSKDMGL
jgi:hypothetical protein